MIIIVKSYELMPGNCEYFTIKKLNVFLKFNKILTKLYLLWYSLVVLNLYLCKLKSRRNYEFIRYVYARDCDRPWNRQHAYYP